MNSNCLSGFGKVGTNHTVPKMVSKVYINTVGDPSVGIFPHCIAFDLGIDVDEGDGFREEVREVLKNCFNEILDDFVEVTFEGEERY